MFRNDNIFKLLCKHQFPISRENKTCEEALSDYYTQYLEELNDLSWDNECCMPQEVYAAVKESIPKIDALCKGILSTMRKVNEANVINAYTEFYELMNTVQPFLYEVSIDRNCPDKISRFFRIRTGEKTFSSRKDLFHIPIENKDKIRPYRFSIAGFPCLYLATDIELCWFECGMPNHYSFSCFEFDKKVADIKFIDFAEDSFSVVSVLDTLSFNVDVHEELISIATNTILRYLITLPLKAACSFSVRNKDVSFIEEYVIPQMVLLWMKEKTGYAGILYRTCSAIESSHDWNCINLVMPARRIEKDYCKYLNEILKMTNPIHVDFNKEVKKHGDGRIAVKAFLNNIESQCYEKGIAVYPYRQLISICKSYLSLYNALIDDKGSDAEVIYQSFLTLNGETELLLHHRDSIKQYAIEDTIKLNPSLKENTIEMQFNEQFNMFRENVIPAIQIFNHYAFLALGTKEFFPTDFKHPLET